MSYTTVRAHTRNGHQVRAHSRRTDGNAVADVLLRELDRAYEELDREHVAPVGPVGGDPACPHPGWHAIRQVRLDMAYEESPILAYACTHCAALLSRDAVAELAEARAQDEIAESAASMPCPTGYVDDF